jgi:hypothetical protein
MISRFSSRPFLQLRGNNAVLLVILAMSAFLCLSPLVGRALDFDAHCVVMGEPIAFVGTGEAEQDLALSDSARAFQIIAPSSVTVILVVIQVLAWRKSVGRERGSGWRMLVLQPPPGRHSRPILTAFRN